MTPATSLATGYRPWLDGLRAVAVAMVVVQHGLGGLPLELGSLGVGLFFALSGYLITSLLLDERAARGRVSLSRFYLRRAARLVPALVIVVVVCNALFAIQHDYGPLRGSLFALTYTANYAQVLGEHLVPAYGPTWSLAVEEHFYILWPLALLWLADRFGLRTALGATLAVCLAALLWRAVLLALDARVLIELGSLERADALLYGCAAAIAVRLGWRPREWMVWAGIAVIGSLTFAFTQPGWGAPVAGSAVLAIAAAAIVVGLDYAAPPLVRRCLSARAVVYIGVLSYGIYLWHGPLMRVANNLDSPYARSLRGIAAIVTIAVAALSYRYAEAPIRAWARRRSDAAAAARRPHPAPLPAVDVAPAEAPSGRGGL